AGTEDHRRHLLAEAGGVPQPVLDPQGWLGAPDLAHRGAHQAHDFVLRIREVTTLHVGERDLGAEPGIRLLGAREAPVDLRANLLDAHAGLRTTVDADHALVRDHRRTAGGQAA